MGIDLAEAHRWHLPHIESLCARIENSMCMPVRAPPPSGGDRFSLLSDIGWHGGKLASWLEVLGPQLGELAASAEQAAAPDDPRLTAARAGLENTVGDLLRWRGYWQRRPLPAADSSARPLLLALIDRLLRTLLRGLMEYARVIQQPETVAAEALQRGDAEMTWSLNLTFTVQDECDALKAWCSVRRAELNGTCPSAAQSRPGERMPEAANPAARWRGSDITTGGWSVAVLVIAGAACVFLALHPAMLILILLTLTAFYVLRHPLILLAALLGLMLGG